jgi:hypothetical protein
VFLVNNADVTTRYNKGRRVKVTVTAGTRYGTVSSSTYSAPNTSVSVIIDGTGALDSGLSAVSYGLLSGPESTAVPPAFSDQRSCVIAYRGTSVQAITSATWNKIQFNTETLDTLGEFDSSVNYRYTPYYQGASYNQVWMMAAQVTLASSIVSAQIAIYKDGAAVCTRQVNSGIAGGTIDIVWFETADGATGHYYEVYVNPSGNVNVSLGAGTTWFVARRMQ